MQYVIELLTLLSYYYCTKLESRSMSFQDDHLNMPGGR